MTVTSFKVVTLPDPLHDFLIEVMNRVIAQGLIVPDELSYAAQLWSRIKAAQVVTTPPPPSAGVPPDSEPESVLSDSTEIPLPSGVQHGRT
jgi:hypothetical protein